MLVGVFYSILQYFINQNYHMKVQSVSTVGGRIDIVMK